MSQIDYYKIIDLEKHGVISIPRGIGVGLTNPIFDDEKFCQLLMEMSLGGFLYRGVLEFFEYNGKQVASKVLFIAARAITKALEDWGDKGE